MTDCQALNRRDINIGDRGSRVCVGTETYYVGAHGISWPSFSHVKAYRGLIACNEEYACVISAASISFKDLPHGVHRDSD